MVENNARTLRHTNGVLKSHMIESHKVLLLHSLQMQFLSQKNESMSPCILGRVLMQKKEELLKELYTRKLSNEINVSMVARYWRLFSSVKFFEISLGNRQKKEKEREREGARKRDRTTRHPTKYRFDSNWFSALWFFYSIVVRPRGNATRFLISCYIDLLGLLLKFLDIFPVTDISFIIFSRNYCVSLINSMIQWIILNIYNS